jgi:uncharacterized protein DUF1153
MQKFQFLTLAEVLEAAKSESFRWTAARKAVVLQAERTGQLTRAEITRRFGVSAEEFAAWNRKIDNHGVAALRATRLQIYEPERRKGRAGAPTPGLGLSRFRCAMPS